MIDQIAMHPSVDSTQLIFHAQTIKQTLREKSEDSRSLSSLSRETKNVAQQLLQAAKNLKREGVRVIVCESLDNAELDVNKEINFLKFINKDQATNTSELLKKEIINTLIDRKIKDIETNYYKIDVSEKEIENSLYNYLERIKISSETLNTFYNKNEIEKDYLKNLIKIDLKWSKLIRQMYESRLNVNLTEVNRQLEQEQKNSDDNEKFKNQLINIEQNKLLNKFAATHLEKSKKKYLIKFL